MGFWREASNQAGREYGARNWRWFAAASILRTTWPAVVVLVITVGAVWGARAAGDALNAREIGRPILIAAVAVAALALLALGTRAAVRRFTGPPRRRRRFR